VRPPHVAGSLAIVAALLAGCAQPGRPTAADHPPEHGLAGWLVTRLPVLADLPGETSVSYDLSPTYGLVMCW
jgi:hypothetical protein